MGKELPRRDIPKPMWLFIWEGGAGRQGVDWRLATSLIFLCGPPLFTIAAPELSALGRRCAVGLVWHDQRQL